MSELLASERRRILRDAAKLLAEDYVFEDLGHAVAQALRERSEADPAPDEARAWVRASSAWLRDRAGDPHLALRWSETARTVTPDARDELDEAAPSEGYGVLNYGFSRVEVLPGRIGVLALSHLLPLAEAEATARAAMGFLGAVGRVIVDLRGNPGGSSEMVAFVVSHLVGPGHALCSLHDRKAPHPWTNESFAVASHGCLGAEVAVLVDRRTASAAESLAHDLHRLARARVFGEPTAGAAHAVRSHRLHPHVRLVLPYARALDPEGRNWHRVGVALDEPCPPEHACERARAWLTRG